MTVWEPGKQPLPAKPRKKMGRPTRLLQRAKDHQPVTIKQLAMNLPSAAYRKIVWREGVDRKLQSRFAAVRVRPAHRDYEKAEPHAEQWLLIEWPKGEEEPAKYWIATLPPDTRLPALVKIAKHRWIIERDYQELIQELGLGHFEGRNWRGFHHHATLCIAAYGFLVAERNRFSPSARAGHLEFGVPGRRTGLPPTRIAAFVPSVITQIRLQPDGWNWRKCCCGNSITVRFADPPARLSVTLEIDLRDTLGSASVWFGAPFSGSYSNLAQLFHRNATPADNSIGPRPESASTTASGLEAKRARESFAATSQHMWAEQPREAIVDRGYRLLA